MDVSEWMTKGVCTVKRQDSLRHARELMVERRINQLPVVINDKLIGIITDRDLRDAYPSSLRRLSGQDIDEFADSHTVETVMTYDVITTNPATTIREAAESLRKQRFGALPVVDHGKLVGIITRSDLLDAFLAESQAEPQR